MKLIFAGNLPPFTGGGAVMGARLLAGLSERGFGVRALAPITPQTADPYAEGPLDVTRFPVPYFEVAPDSPNADGYGRAEAKGLRAGLASMIAAERPDVVIAGRETFAWHVPDVARAHALPSVVILQGTTTAGMVRGTYPRADELVERYRRADLVVVPARHMTRVLAPYGLTNVEVIPNTVDVEAFRPRPGSPDLLRRLSVQDADVVVAHASILEPVKRPMHLVEAAARALAVDERLLFVVLGEGSGRRQMEEACARLGIAERFRFTGWVNHDDVPEYLNVADIVVMTSEFEAQSLAKLEAQACGRLLLSSDVDGARELVDDGRTGLLYRSGDVDDLVAKILLAAADPELRAAIGRRARAAAMAHSRGVGVSAYVRALEAVVRSAAAGSGSSRSTSSSAGRPSNIGLTSGR